MSGCGVPTTRRDHGTCSSPACAENASGSASCHPFGELSGCCVEAVSPLLARTVSACSREPAPAAACGLLLAVRLLSAHISPSLSDLSSAAADVDHGAAESVSPDGLLSGLCCGVRCTPRCLGRGARVADAALHMMRKRAAKTCARQHVFPCTVAGACEQSYSEGGQSDAAMEKWRCGDRADVRRVPRQAR